MIHEYAIDPNVVVTWGEASNVRVFRDAFGIGQPRIMSAYPTTTQWKKLFHQQLESRKANMGDMEINRAVAKAENLLESSVAREKHDFKYDGKTWLQNAIIGGLRYPFQGILSDSNPTNNDQVIVADQINLTDIPRWDVRRAATPNRTVAEMAAEFAPMLRIAKTIVVVDPYFRAGKRDRRFVLEGLFDKILENRTVVRPDMICVLVAANYQNVQSLQAFNDECQSKMPSHIRKDLSVTFIRLVEKEGGEKLHNRYVITDHGGVKLGNTLEESDPGATDDANLMDTAQYKFRHDQYFPEVRSGQFVVPGFHIEDNAPPVVVRGVKE